MVVDKLLKKYDKKVVVDSVSFSIPKGKVTSFIGPNGAGKSTVMGMISRLIANDAGIIEFQGKSMHDWKSKELAKHLAILTQSNNIQMKLTVEELVAFGRFPHSGGRLTDKDKDIINKSIEYMELNELLMALMVLSLTACGNQTSKDNRGLEGTTEPASVTITTLNGQKEQTQLEVPYNPERIAILDLAALDIIDSIGVGDKVVGMAQTSIDYLSHYSENKSIKNLGTIKEADIEAVMECEPDIIFIGGRLSASYDKLSEIAPVVYLATDSSIGLVESTLKNARTIASIFGKENEVEDKVNQYNDRINNLKNIASGKNALVGMTTSGSFNILGNDGRCSIIGNEIGFNNLGATGSTSAHGNEASFETVVAKNPEYIFVMDRDKAIGKAGAESAKEIVENDLVKSTPAYKNNHIVYLENPNVWYTAEGGIQALDMMLKDLEKGLGVK